MHRSRTHRLLVGVAVALALAASTAGCATWRGARLYHSGTEALDRGETDRAVVELEHAARLVPHASEVQNHLGLAYLAQGRDRDALRAFQRAVELDCDNRAAVRNLHVTREQLDLAPPDEHLLDAPADHSVAAPPAPDPSTDPVHR